MRVKLVGGRYHGHIERMDTVTPPATVSMVDCPHCRRTHLVSADHWVTWKGDIDFYWLDQGLWQATGRQENRAIYRHADPGSDLETLELLDVANVIRRAHGLPEFLHHLIDLVLAAPVAIA